MCLTYCVPLVDSLCSFVRVQHVFGVACVNVVRKVRCVWVWVWVCACVYVHSCFYGCGCVCVSVCVCMCVNECTRENLFKKKLYQRKSLEKKGEAESKF